MSRNLPHTTHSTSVWPAGDQRSVSSSVLNPLRSRSAAFHQEAKSAWYINGPLSPSRTFHSWRVCGFHICIPGDVPDFSWRFHVVRFAHPAGALGGSDYSVEFVSNNRDRPWQMVLCQWLSSVLCEARKLTWNSQNGYRSLPIRSNKRAPRTQHPKALRSLCAIFYRMNRTLFGCCERRNSFRSRCPK